MPPSYVPVVSTVHLVVRQLISITRQAHTLGTTRTYPKSEGSAMTHSTRVALHDPHGVSTIPLTNPPPKHCTIFSRASMESQATKPSRMWQPPRITSNAGLQLDHLVPLDATSRCNRTRIALTQSDDHYQAYVRWWAPNPSQAWTQSPPRCSIKTMAETPFYL